MMKMLPYTFTAEWVKGKHHLATDALSQFPVDEPCLEDELCELHGETAVNVHFVDKSTTTCHLNELFHHQQADDTLLNVIMYKLGGLTCEMKPTKKHVHSGSSQPLHGVCWRELYFCL